VALFALTVRSSTAWIGVDMKCFSIVDIRHEAMVMAGNPFRLLSPGVGSREVVMLWGWPHGRAGALVKDSYVPEEPDDGWYTVYDSRTS
jgi:hypothetical protein